MGNSMKVFAAIVISLFLMTSAYAQIQDKSTSDSTVSNDPVSQTAQVQQEEKKATAEEKKWLNTTLDIAGLAALCALAVTVWANKKTIKTTSKSTSDTISVSRFQEIYKEYASADFRADLMFVRNDLQKLYPPDRTTTLYSLTKEATHIRSVTRVSHFFDFVGMLMAHKLLDEDLIIIFLGGSAERTWKILYPYIDNQRNQIGDDLYQAHFENLAATSYYNPESRRIGNYNLKKYPRNM